MRSGMGGEVSEGGLAPKGWAGTASKHCWLDMCLAKSRQSN